MVKDGWNGFNVLHTDASMVGALDIGFVPGRAVLTSRPCSPAASTCCSTSAPTRSRSRPAAFVIYQGTPWRPRRASRRCHPAGRGLHREIRDLRQYGGSAAGDEPRRLPAGRGQGRLGDPPRALRRRRQAPAVRQPRRNLRRSDLRGSSRISRTRQPCGRRMPRPSASSPRARPTPARRLSPRPSTTFHLTNPIARASAVMAECASLAKGSIAAGGGVTRRWLSRTFSGWSALILLKSVVLVVALLVLVAYLLYADGSARSGRRCSCAADPTWSVPGACSRASPIC